MIPILIILDLVLIVTCIIIIVKKEKAMKIMASIILILVIIINILIGIEIYEHIRISNELSEQLKYNSEHGLKQIRRNKNYGSNI